MSGDIFSPSLLQGTIVLAQQSRLKILWRYISLLNSIIAKPIMGASPIIAFHEDSSLLGMMSNNCRALLIIPQFAYKVMKAFHIDISEQNLVPMTWAWTSLPSFKAPKLAHPLTTVGKMNLLDFMLASSIWRKEFQGIFSVSILCISCINCIPWDNIALWHLTVYLIF